MNSKQEMNRFQFYIPSINNNISQGKMLVLFFLYAIEKDIMDKFITHPDISLVKGGPSLYICNDNMWYEKIPFSTIHLL